MCNNEMFSECVENQIQYPSKQNYCFFPDVKAECKALTKRLCKLQPRQKRIYTLAIPKQRRNKHEAMCARFYRRPIEIIRAYDQTESTRIKMLSYATVRRLLSNIEEKRSVLSPQRLQVLYSWVRKSLLSVYSRLYSLELPEIILRPRTWTPKDWRIHLRYLRRLSRPRKPKPLPEEPKDYWMIDDFNRTFNFLSVPKHIEESPSPQWTLNYIKGYKPSDRTLRLAAPKIKVDNNFVPLPIVITDSAKKYKPTKRIKELSTPREKRLEESDLKENPFGISPNALKGKASVRTKKLAEPKEYEESQNRKDFSVSPAALKAKATPRTIELAKPKGK